MKKLFLAVAVASLGLFSTTSCKKETTCTCQWYELEDDGSKTPSGDPETKVIDSNDADCSRFNETENNPVGNDRVYECEEEVLD